MENFNLLTEKIKDIIKNDTKLNATLKFDTDKGPIYVDATQVPNVLSNEDKEADTVIKIKAENAVKLINGDLNGMVAFTMGKIKVKGDMGVAMKLMQLLS